MIYYGVCYYPEHYPIKDRRVKMAEDIQNMKELSFNVVRIAEFAWCEMEPEEGKFEFDWLDEIINILGENGIYSVLCTPTAAPPVWMSVKYPEILYRNPDGSMQGYDGRRFTCYNSPKYREKCEIIVRKLAERYGRNPYVIGFQVDNEFAQEENGRCTCDICKEKFRAFLRNKYSSIDELNELWGTIFWGQKYSSFDEIIPPKTLIGVNPTEDPVHYLGVDSPSLRLDFERFCSDSMISLFELQKKILQQYSDKPVTHNSTGIGRNQVDFGKLFTDADVVGVDHYPSARSLDKTKSSITYSFARCLKDKPFWLLETLCGGGHGNWAFQGMPQEYPGAFRNNILYAYANGAELITMFKYYVFRSGFEQLGSALLDLDRIKRRRFYEFKQTGQDVAKLKEILENTRVESKIAMVFHYDSCWVNGIKPINRTDCYSYVTHFAQIYKTLMQLGVNVDVITKEHTLVGYEIVILPNMAVADEKFINRLKEWVAGGKTVVATYLTGSRDEFGCGSEQPMPINMTDLFGIRVGEVEPAFDQVTAVDVRFDGKVYRNRYWSEVLESCGAEIIAEYASSYKEGWPAFSHHKYGAGDAYYLGTTLNEDGEKEIYSKILMKSGVKLFPFMRDNNVEIVKRVGHKEIYYFVFNMAEEEKIIEYFGNSMDILSGRHISGKTKLFPKKVLVIKEY
jgi:beta-galactosidase